MFGSFDLTPAWGWLLTILTILVSVLAIVNVLRQRREPMAMLAWVVAFTFIPVLPVFLYFLIGERRVKRRGRRKRKKSAAIIRAIASAAEQEEGSPALAGSGVRKPLDVNLDALATISSKLGNFPLTGGNKVEIFTTAQETYEDILRAIDQAEDHIHLEYYIFRPDETGRMFIERLAKRAREGVEVRLLLDGVGSWWTPRRFLRPLVEAGGKLDTFLPAIPWRQPWHLNCRNHRKIVVVDGHIAYTGSQNIGDEYRGRMRRVAPWKDTHVRIEGPAARELQEVFIEDWFYASREDLTSRRYLRNRPAAGDSLVQIVPTGPDQAHGILTHIHFAAISLARKSIRIGTPYFVPDPSLVASLQNAALRGIDVEILIPSKTDNRVALWAGRSFYEELIQAGVRIHEFDEGMLHSKTVNIDDHWTLISSANMDIRSFLWNFEVTVSVFDEKISTKLVEDFKTNLRRSRRIELPKGAPPLIPSVLEGIARLLSPLL